VHVCTPVCDFCLQTCGQIARSDNIILWDSVFITSSPYTLWSTQIVLRIAKAVLQLNTKATFGCTVYGRLLSASAVTKAPPGPDAQHKSQLNVML